ncbi:suppressor of lurcher protein 1-like isoform X2 [Lineus longissimus]|uniref:suppressor of lurcher protein 1-like isoform X2 n=1 Tax=Lineus longissimus TaxID=88925 RepID=UPI00315C8226
MMVSIQVLVILYLNSLISLCIAVNPDEESCIAYESTYHIDRACVCVLYQSDAGITYDGYGGIFQSPNYPAEYPENTNCILYTFIGNVGEIVELTFIAFDLQMPDKNNRCEDFLSFFLNLPRPEINEHNHPDYKLCGTMEMIQKVYYSSGRALILEFHTNSYNDRNTGFQGRFKFLSADEFVTNGIKQYGTQCTYIMASSQRKKGKFFSPQYPQNYPADAECQYVFKGMPEEQVVVTFENIQLERLVGRCIASPDHITIRDGVNSSSHMIIQHCDTRNNVESISSGPYLFVQFLADSKNQRQGFSATYEFLSQQQMRERTQKKIDLLYPTSATDQVTNCNQVIVSTRNKNGTITSPNYPNTYPSYSSCRYTFQGQGKERVQITFTDFDLYYTHSDRGNPSDCQGVDSVKAATFISNENVEMSTYCGAKIPPMLMSSDLELSLTFTSTSTAVGVRGFKAKYSFVTNFGITGGRQDPHSVCGFIYRSKSTRNGTFASPNYPGLYPRNTECQYLFYGEKNYRVHIKFLDFSVEGMLKDCAESSYSDYVEFSNIANVQKNKKLLRYCGVRMSQIYDVESEGEFFRVTFKSNSIYDATGFKARYEFKRYDDSGVEQVKVSGRGPSVHQNEEGSDPSTTKRIKSSADITKSSGLFSLVCILLISAINS